MVPSLSGHIAYSFMWTSRSVHQVADGFVNWGQGLYKSLPGYLPSCLSALMLRVRSLCILFPLFPIHVLI